VERSIAEKLMKLMLSIDEPLNIASELSRKIEDVEEAKLLRRGIGEILSKTYDVMVPIVRQYPDLDPTKNART